MATEKEIAAEEVNIASANKTIRHQDFRSLYLNHLQIGMTRWDVQMVLGLVQISKADGFQDTIQETACVVMTPAYAKALVLDLGATLQRYEAMYGEIQAPRPLDKPVDQQK